jgi:hypothetical protein
MLNDLRGDTAEHESVESGQPSTSHHDEIAPFRMLENHRRGSPLLNDDLT